MANRFAKSFNLATVVRCLGAAGGNWDQAAQVAQRDYAWNRHTTEIVKAAAGALDTANMNQTYAYGQAVENFIESLRQFSPFDAMKSAMRELPLQTAIYGTTGISGSVVAEGEYAPVSAIELFDDALARRKASALVVLTVEAFNTEGFLPYLQRELVVGAAAAVNREFLAGLAAVAEEETSAGTTPANVMTDLSKLLGHIAKRGSSSLYLIVGPDTAANLAVKNASGVMSFPDMGPNGGSVANITTLVSDELPTDSDGHQAILVDADGIAYGDEGIEVTRSAAATIRMSDDPENDVGPAEINLFQTDSTALLVRRMFGFKAVRDDAVAILKNVQW